MPLSLCLPPPALYFSQQWKLILPSFWCRIETVIWIFVFKLTRVRWILFRWRWRHVTLDLCSLSLFGVERLLLSLVAALAWRTRSTVQWLRPWPVRKSEKWRIAWNRARSSPHWRGFQPVHFHVELLQNQHSNMRINQSHQIRRRKA